MKTLIYTFRTFPHLTKLQEIFSNIIVIDKVRNDTDDLCKHIQLHKPDFILGIANSQRSVSTLEKYAINSFHTKGSVIKNSSIQKLSLHIPEKILFSVREKPTNSFCNYTMFKIQHFLNKNDLSIPFTFIHITKHDIKNLKCIL